MTNKSDINELTKEIRGRVSQSMKFEDGSSDKDRASDSRNMTASKSGFLRDRGIVPDSVGRGAGRALKENGSDLKNERAKIIAQKKEKENEAKRIADKKMSKLDLERKKYADKVKKNIEKRKKEIKKIKSLKIRAKQKLKGAVQMDARKGKSPLMYVMYAFFFILALANDFSDFFLEVLGFVVSLTGVGVAILAIAEVLKEIFDIVTGGLLLAFTLYIGGVTKSGLKSIVKDLVRFAGAGLVEVIPVIGMFFSWTLLVLYNVYQAIKRADEAEAKE